MQNHTAINRNAQQAAMSGREVEASVLTRGALLLKQCQDSWNTTARDHNLEEALKFNQLTWTIFQSELSNPENPLPKRLREDLIRLAVFVDRRIFEIMEYPDREKLSAIIKINLNIAAGLKERPGD